MCESAEGFKDLGGLFTAEKENRMIVTLMWQKMSCFLDQHNSLGLN